MKTLIALTFALSLAACGSPFSGVPELGSVTPSPTATAQSDSGAPAKDPTDPPRDSGTKDSGNPVKPEASAPEAAVEASPEAGTPEAAPPVDACAGFCCAGTVEDDAGGIPSTPWTYTYDTATQQACGTALGMSACVTCVLNTALDTPQCSVPVSSAPDTFVMALDPVTTVVYVAEASTSVFSWTPNCN